MSDDRTLPLALAKLREGTEILRTGGGIFLEASQCNALLDEYERLRTALREFADIVLGTGDTVGEAEKPGNNIPDSIYNAACKTDEALRENA